MQGSIAADSAHNHEHNLNPEYRAKLKNVDASRTHLNVTLLADSIEDVYEECFGEAVRAYNDKQKRNDRKIESYYKKICESKQEHAAYEIVIQLGDKDNNSAIGLDDMDRVLMESIYETYFHRFQERWGSVLRVFEAVMHFDEATPHMHLAYVPVAHNKGSRGLSVKNSQRQAMQELGYYLGSKEERTDFYHDAQEMLTEVMREHGIEREASRYDRANRGDMTQEEYVQFAANQEKIAQAKIELETLESKKEEIEKEIEFSSGKLDRMAGALESNERLIEKMHGKLNEKISEYHEAENSLQKAKTEIGDLLDEKYALKNEIRTLETDRIMLSRDVADLEKKKGSLESAVEKLKDILSQLTDTIERYAPNPILELAMYVRRGFDFEVEKWHERMNHAADVLSWELPSSIELNNQDIEEYIEERELDPDRGNPKKLRNEWDIGDQL